jgi:hypothetical protein
VDSKFPRKFSQQSESKEKKNRFGAKFCQKFENQYELSRKSIAWRSRHSQTGSVDPQSPEMDRFVGGFKIHKKIFPGFWRSENFWNLRAKETVFVQPCSEELWKWRTKGTQIDHICPAAQREIVELVHKRDSN